MNTIYSLKFWEKAWLIKYELVFGCFKLPCLFLYNAKEIDEDILYQIGEYVKSNMYDWKIFNDVKNYLSQDVHPELKEIEFIAIDMENSVIYDISTLNYIQWLFLKDKLPYLNIYKTSLNV